MAGSAVTVERRRAWLEPMPGTRILGVRPDGRLLLTPLLEVGVTAGGLVVAHDVSQAQAVWALLQQGGRTEVLGRPLKVNGRAGREVTLQDRDLLELEGANLRYREEVWAESVEEALEAALREEPADRARWLVWADWLLEHGELSTGQRVVAQSSGPALLEGFEPLVASGGLEVDWRNGFPFALKLSCANGARDLGVLLSVLGLPCLRFLHTLEVDVASFVRRPRPEVPSPVLQVQAAAAGVLATLAREGLPSLRRLLLGPVWEGVELLPAGFQANFSPALEWLEEQERSLEPAAREAERGDRRDGARLPSLEANALARACPRLIRPSPDMSAAHVQRHRAVWLESADPAQPRILLQPGLRQDLGGIRLEFYEVGWAAVPALVAASSGAQLNGAPFGFGELRMLRAGDLLDGGHGLVFRVGVEWA